VLVSFLRVFFSLFFDYIYRGSPVVAIKKHRAKTVNSKASPADRPSTAHGSSANNRQPDAQPDAALSGGLRAARKACAYTALSAPRHPIDGRR
jgi:hypothetical protein